MDSTPAEAAIPALNSAAPVRLTYGQFTTDVSPHRITTQTIEWFRSGACPLMAWALVHQAAQHGHTWHLALIGDARNWGNWWHMGALTEDKALFVDVGGAHDVDLVCAWWHEHHKERRHPGDNTAVYTVSDLFYSLIWYDPRHVNSQTRETTLTLADQVLADNGFHI
ncbi:hypothetical protein [Nocardiopsis synnemataformans]|uniref:hypothetical protein n=1 Tax=Nocardiopsis synnemataformans TaxID=61305 RepID=UPI003EBCFAE5